MDIPLTKIQWSRLWDLRPELRHELATGAVPSTDWWLEYVTDLADRDALHSSERASWRRLASKIRQAR